MSLPENRIPILAAILLVFFAGQAGHRTCRQAAAGEAAVSAPVSNSPGKPKTLDEALRGLERQIEQQRARTEKIKQEHEDSESAKAKPEDLKHDTQLPREEQIRRHKFRVQNLLGTYRTEQEERRLGDLIERRDAVNEYKYKIHQRYVDALGGLPDPNKISKEDLEKAMASFRREIDAERTALDDKITSARLVCQRELNRMNRLRKQIQAQKEKDSTASTASSLPQDETRLERLSNEAQALFQKAMRESEKAELQRLVLDEYMLRAEGAYPPRPPTIAAAPVAEDQPSPPIVVPVPPVPVPAPPLREIPEPPEVETPLPPKPPTPAPGQTQSYTLRLKPPVQVVVLEVPETAEIQPAGGPVGFLRDRFLDCADLFRFRLHLPRGGRGIGFKARGTCLAQAGLLFFDGRSAGFDRRGMGLWNERRFEGGIGPAYLTSVQSEIARGNRYTDIRHPWSKLCPRGIVRNDLVWDDGRRHPLSCGGEFQMLLFGFEFEVYPLEWADLALGWAGLDPANDDDCRMMARWHRLQSIPELAVRDEWSESLDQYKKEEAEAPEGTTRRGVKVDTSLSDEIAPLPIEQPIEAPETSAPVSEAATPEE